MKIGIAISIIVGLFVILFAILFISPPPDAPTRATREEVLQLATLPEDMPTLFTATKPQDDAESYLQRAIALYRADEQAFEGSYFDRPVVEQAATYLIAAAKAGQVPHGFIDRDAPVRVGGGRIDSPLMPVAAKVMQLGREQISENNLDQARVTIAAVFSLGHRAFIHNDLLGSKQFGLMLMNDAGSQLFDLYQSDQQQLEQITTAANAVNGVYDAWQPKLQIVLSIDPHVGDLLNIAQNDQDRTFRIAATAQLGLARFTDGGAGNHRAIEAYLEQAKESDDPLIVEAATAAAAMTREQVRRLR